MTQQSNPIFRAAAVDRLASPDQLDQLVRVTRPVDWLAAVMIVLTIVALTGWGFWGRVPTRVAGDGLLIGDGGTIADAVAATAGRLGSVDVAVGDRVTEGQVVAHLSQGDIEARAAGAVATVREREREHQELGAAIDRELTALAASTSARKTGQEQVIASSEERAATLVGDLTALNAMIKQGLATQLDIEQLRVELSAARQRITDARNEIMALDGLKADREAQRARERMLSQFRVDDARREADQLSAALERDTRVVSPIAGRVTEIKVSPGAVLAPGTPVVAIETIEKTLRAMVYLPADGGKTVLPGMAVRIAPATVKREEFGTLMGTVVSVSDFPETPEGMAAILHNGDLVKKFAENGVLYGAVVQLTTDADSVSGYRWSSGNGPPAHLSSGTLAHAEITTRERRPVDLVLPLIRRMSGSDF